MRQAVQKLAPWSIVGPVVGVKFFEKNVFE
jgi:hypothetical protein